MLAGTGHGEPGDFSTITTPASANASRRSEPVLGFSLSSTQAMSTDHAGIR